MRTAILTFVLLLVFALPLQAHPSNAYVLVAHGSVNCCGHTLVTPHSGVGGEAVTVENYPHIGQQIPRRM